MKRIVVILLALTLLLPLSACAGGVESATLGWTLGDAYDEPEVLRPPRTCRRPSLFPHGRWPGPGMCRHHRISPIPILP